MAVFSCYQVGLKYSESVVIRITGCPNGCARPYMAELGLVGDGPNSYQVYHELQANDLLLAKWKLLGMRTQILYICEILVSYEKKVHIFLLLHVYVCLSCSDMAWGNTQSNVTGKDFYG